MPSLSIITTSYNQLKSLRYLLASLKRQTCSEFELLIADDGSSDGTAEFCRSLPGSLRSPIRFLTQPDQGYRKSRILNAALRETRGEYVIFLDSDVFLERHFIEDHLKLRRPESFVCGRRVELGPLVSDRLREEEVEGGSFDFPNRRLLLSLLRRDTPTLKRAIRISSQTARQWLGYERELDILGSNFGAWKNDLIEINGFNEQLESYWGEDGDLFIRLRNSGKRPISALGLCVQYHVHHARREPDQEMMKKYESLLKDDQYKWAEKGLKSR